MSAIWACDWGTVRGHGLDGRRRRTINRAGSGGTGLALRTNARFGFFTAISFFISRSLLLRFLRLVGRTFIIVAGLTAGAIIV